MSGVVAHCIYLFSAEHQLLVRFGPIQNILVPQVDQGVQPEEEGVGEDLELEGHEHLALLLGDRTGLA